MGLNLRKISINIDGRNEVLKHFDWLNVFPMLIN